MEIESSYCIIVNNNFCVYTKQEFPINEFEFTPHAPIQALILARKEDVDGGTAYVSRFPCYVCAKALVAAGIKKVVYKEENEFEKANVEKANKVFEFGQVEIVKNETIEVE